MRAMSSLSLRVDSPSGSEKTEDRVGLTVPWEPVDEGGELNGLSRLAFISLRIRERYRLAVSTSMAAVTRPRRAENSYAVMSTEGGEVGRSELRRVATGVKE